MRISSFILQEPYKFKSMCYEEEIKSLHMEDFFNLSGDFQARVVEGSGDLFGDVMRARFENDPKMLNLVMMKRKNALKGKFSTF